MRRIVSLEDKESPNTEPDFSLAATDLEELGAKAQEILRREITNLMVESSGRKLSPTSSAALVQYIKLLGELKEKEDEQLRNLGDEHLAKLAGK